MNQFWITFVVTEAIGVAQAYVAVAVANNRPNFKAALEGLINAGNAVIIALQAGN